MDPILSTEEYEQRIRERAEQLWEEAGRPEGDSDHFWFMAQRAFDAEHPEYAHRHAGDPQPTSPVEEPHQVLGENG